MADDYQRPTQGRLVYVVLTSLGVLNALILAFLQRYWSSVRRSVVLQVCFVFIAMSNVAVVAVYIVVFTSSVSLLRTCTSSASRKLVQVVGGVYRKRIDMSDAAQKLVQLVSVVFRKRLRCVAVVAAAKCVTAILTAFCCYTSIAAQKLVRFVGIGKKLHCVTLVGQPAAAKFVFSVIKKLRYFTLASAAQCVTVVMTASFCYYYLTVLRCALIGCTVGFYLLYCIRMKHRARAKPNAMTVMTSTDHKDPCQDWQMFKDRLETSLQRELQAISSGLSLDLSPNELIDYLPNNGARHAEMNLKGYVVCNAGYAIDTAYVDGDGTHTWVRLPSRIASELRHDFLRRCFVSQSESASGVDSVWALLSGRECQQLLQDSLSDSQTTTNDIVITRSVYGAGGYSDCKITLSLALEYSGWPRVARSWMRNARRHLPAYLLSAIVDDGCYLVYRPCNNERCRDHSYDWTYDFPQAEKRIFEYYRGGCGDAAADCFAAYRACRRAVANACVHNECACELLLSMLKHVFLHHAQKHIDVRHRQISTDCNGAPVSNLYKCGNEFVCKLLACAVAGKLRHYFMQRVNLLDSAIHSDILVSVNILKLLKVDSYRYLQNNEHNLQNTSRVSNSGDVVEVLLNDEVD